MAEDKKPDINLDDWDNLPLDPDNDDWDDIPPPPPKSSGSEPVRNASTEDAEKSSVDDFDSPPLPDSDNTNVDFDDQPDDLSSDSAAPSIDEPDSSTSQFITDDDFDTPSQSVNLEDDFDSPVSMNNNETETKNESVTADDDFDAPAETTSQPADFAEQLADVDGEPEDSLAIIDDIPSLPTKKVELDIEGMFLDDVPADTGDEEVPEEDEPPVEDAVGELEAAPEEPVRKKIPKIKLLIIVVPAVLVLGGVIFGIYTFFIADSEPDYIPPPLIIDPNLPPREPQPGELGLETFYINFPGRPADTIVEMSVVLHYDDTSDMLAIQQGMTTIRDIIFRITQSKGNQIITSGEMQSTLREELKERANLALGGDHVAYVQINQIRILQ